MNNTASYPLFTVPDEVHEALALLRDIDSHAYLAGGALRDLVLGNEPNDYDVFVVSESPEETDCIHTELVMSGYVQQHCASYDSEGYISDYRKGDVNVIIYSNTLYKNIVELIEGFDLNMNMFLYDDLEEREVQNLAGWDVTKPVKVHNRSKSNRVQDRVFRFKKKYPTLNWREVGSYND